MSRVFARLHTLATTPEQYDVGLELVRDELLRGRARAAATAA
jgi:hypothetical protein